MPVKDSVWLQNRNRQLEQENRLLRARIDWLIKRCFGGEKSERIDPKQLELLLAGLSEGEPGGSEEAAAEAPAPVRERQKPGRRRLPDHLEVEEIVIEPAEVEAEPQKWRCIGQEVTEELDLIPAKFIKGLQRGRPYNLNIFLARARRNNGMEIEFIALSPKEGARVRNYGTEMKALKLDQEEEE